MNKRIHYAWIIVGVCFVILMCMSGMVLSITSVFLKPVSEALGLTRSEFTSYTLVSGVFGMLASANAGGLIKKFGVRKIVLVGGMLNALALAGYSFSNVIWQFWLWGALSGFSCGFASLVPCSLLLSNWFQEKGGTATSIAFMGTSTGTLVFSRLGSAFLELWSWRIAYLIFSVILLVTIMVVTIFFLVETPEQKGCLPYGSKKENPPDAKNTLPSSQGVSQKRFKRSGAFPCLVIACLLSGIVILGVQNHLLAYLSDLGYVTTAASNIYTIQLFVQMGGKLLLGAILDRFGMRIAMCYICINHLIGMLGFIFAGRLPFAVIGAVCLGLSAGVCTIIPPFLTRLLVGQKEYASIFGVVNVFVSLGSTASTTVTSVIYDHLGGYHAAWGLYVAGMILLTALVFKALRLGSKLTWE